MVEEELRHRFFRDPRVRKLLPELEQQVASNSLPPATAARLLLAHGAPGTP
jgi:hypothetical protein